MDTETDGFEGEPQWILGLMGLGESSVDTEVDGWEGSYMNTY